MIESPEDGCQTVEGVICPLFVARGNEGYQSNLRF